MRTVTGESQKGKRGWAPQTKQAEWVQGVSCSLPSGKAGKSLQRQTRFPMRDTGAA